MSNNVVPCVSSSHYLCSHIMSGTLEEYVETILKVTVAFEELYDHTLISFYVFSINIFLCI